MSDATGVRQYAGAAIQSALTAGISNSATSFSISPTTGWPDGSIGNFVLTIDPNSSSEEKILCSALAGGVITVVNRGYDNTTAVAHTASSTVIHTITAIDIAESNWIANFHARTSKSTPVDNDEFPIADSAASNGLKKLTWVNLKATLKTYLDTIYSAFASYTTTATAAGTTTLIVSSTRDQFFTGSTTQTVLLPVTSTLVLGQRFKITNNSTGVVTVQSSGANTILAIPTLTEATFECISLSGTGTASWDFKISGLNVAPGGMTLISSTALSSTSVTLASIPQTYKKLYLVVENFNLQTTVGHIYIQCNGSATANEHRWAATAAAFPGVTSITVAASNAFVYATQDNVSTTPNPNMVILEIYDYASTVSWKSFNGQFNYLGNAGSNYAEAVVGGFWANIAAISSLKIGVDAGTFVSGTAYLYGVN